MPKLVVFALVTFLHDLFTVVWIGGLATLALAVLPAAREALGKGPSLLQLMDRVQRRLSTLVYVSMVGLAVTGLLLAQRTGAFGGLFSVANAYSAVLSGKHVLMLLMVAVALARSVALRRPAALKPPQQKLGAALIYLNLALGVAVLALSGAGAALATAAPLAG